MKILSYTVVFMTLCTATPASAAIITDELNKNHPKVVTHLNPGDSLIVHYDLSRGFITRELEWVFYAVFCSTLGKAELKATDNTAQVIKKIPVLMSTEEYGQENIGTNIDPKGELKITNLSEFYSGTIVTCELYHKFGQ